jgi:hypothetical protein
MIKKFGYSIIEYSTLPNGRTHLPPAWLLMIIKPKTKNALSGRFPTPQAVR